MIRARDLLNLAESLSRGATEAEWRCAVGRAYYAAFHQARDMLQALGFQIPRAELVHAFLWKRLRSCGQSSVGRAGSKLHELRSVRNRADDDVTFDFLNRHASTNSWASSSSAMSASAGMSSPVQTMEANWPTSSIQSRPADSRADHGRRMTMCFAPFGRPSCME